MGAVDAGEGRVGSNPVWLARPTMGGFSVCSSHHDAPPRQAGVGGSLYSCSVYPPNTLFPNTLRAPLTDLAFIVQVKLHVLLWKSQSKTGISLEAGSPLQLPGPPLRARGQVLTEPTPTLPPWRGLDSSPIISAVVSKERAHPACTPLPQVP